MDCYNVRIVYVIPMVTTKKVSVEYTPATAKNPLNTKEAARKGMRTKSHKTCRKKVTK